ncbi:MAG: SRPBCC domain-containing protein [Acidimicrobiales bacterium]
MARSGGVDLGERIEFQYVGDEPRTLLVCTIRAPIDAVFAAWTDAELLRQWYGPHVTTVSECFMDPTEGGAYRITMRAPDGTEFPVFGTVHHVEAPRHLELVVDLSEHPEEFVRTFRPVGSELESVALRWYYEIDLHDQDGSTSVEVRATYPVREDRDRMIEMDGATGWNESFERLDALLS